MRLPTRDEYLSLSPSAQARARVLAYADALDWSSPGDSGAEAIIEQDDKERFEREGRRIGMPSEGVDAVLKAWKAKRQEIRNNHIMTAILRRQAF